MKLLTLQKRAVWIGLISTIIGIAYAFLDPAQQYEQLNQLIAHLAIPQFGVFNTWVVIFATFICLLLYFIFYFLAFRNSQKAVYVFIGAATLSIVANLSDLGPQVSSGISESISIISNIVDGIIIACLLISRADDANS